MSNEELEQTRFIAIYGHQLHGIARQAADRVLSSKRSIRLVNAQKECIAFEALTNSWKSEFVGSERDRELFDKFIITAKNAFSELIHQRIDEAERHNRDDDNFSEELELIRREMSGQPTSSHAASEENECDKANLQTFEFVTSEEIGVEILRRNPNFTDSLVKRAGNIANDVMVAIGSHSTAKETLKIFDRSISKLRLSLWSEVRDFKNRASVDTIRVWVNTTAASVAHYAAAILSGASIYRLDPKQSKIFETTIQTYRFNFLQEMSTMNNAASINETAVNNETINPTSEKTEMNNAQAINETVIDATVPHDETVQQVNTEKTAASGEETTATTEEAPGAKNNSFYQRAKDRVKAVDWSGFAKYGKYVLYMIAVFALMVGVLFGLKHFTASESIIEALKKLVAPVKDGVLSVFKKIGDFFKGTKVDAEIPQGQAA